MTFLRGPYADLVKNLEIFARWRSMIFCGTGFTVQKSTRWGKEKE